LSSNVESSFAFKWRKVPSYGKGRTLKDHKAWFIKRYDFLNEGNLMAFLNSSGSVLDVGCGSGINLRWFRRLAPRIHIVGFDLPEVVKLLSRRGLGRIADLRGGDLLESPPPGQFDLVVCDQVLQHIPDPKRALNVLRGLTRLGGTLLVNMYAWKGPTREAVDAYLRSATVPMTRERAWQFAEVITRFARDLRRFDWGIQEDFYRDVMKCFWREGWTFAENTAVNFDWYHPEVAHRMTPDEFLNLIKNEMCLVPKWTDINPSNISVRCVKE